MLRKISSTMHIICQTNLDAPTPSGRWYFPEDGEFVDIPQLGDYVSDVVFPQIKLEVVARRHFLRKWTFGYERVLRLELHIPKFLNIGVSEWQERWRFLKERDSTGKEGVWPSGV